MAFLIALLLLIGGSPTRAEDQQSVALPVAPVILPSIDAPLAAGPSAVTVPQAPQLVYVAPAALPALAPAAAAAPVKFSAASPVASASSVAGVRSAGERPGKGLDGGALFDGETLKFPSLPDNFPGVDRSADYMNKARALAAPLAKKVDLRQTLAIGDDAQAELWAKLKALQVRGAKLAPRDSPFDGLVSGGGKTWAVTARRLYVHPAVDRRSEVREAEQRARDTIRDAARDLARRDKRDGLSGVVVILDTRGLPEVKQLLRDQPVPNLDARVKVQFLDDLAPSSGDAAATRADLGRLLQRYQNDPRLEELVNSVLASRWAGLVWELKTLTDLDRAGWQVLRSGVVVFDKRGRYVTEIDGIAKSPQGKVQLVESKSLRGRGPVEEILKQKVLNKLDNLKGHRADVEKALGAPLNVLFSFDVGDNKGLAEYLKKQESALSQKYGFPVAFRLTVKN